MTAIALWTPRQNPRIVAARVLASETVNNSDVLVASDYLKFNVGPSERWSVEIYLRKLSTVATIKYQYSIPTGATFKYTRTNTTPGVETNEDDNDTVTSDAQIEAASYRGILTIGSTAGTFNVLFAQNAADMSDTILAIHSYLIATKL
jgi:hypothetical protein